MCSNAQLHYDLEGSESRAFPLQTSVIPFLPKWRKPVDDCRLLKMDGGYQNVESSLRQSWKGQRISGDPSCCEVRWDWTGGLGRLNIATESQELKQQRGGRGRDARSCGDRKKQALRSGLWDSMPRMLILLEVGLFCFKPTLEDASSQLPAADAVPSYSLPATTNPSPYGAVSPNKVFPISCFWS